MKYLSTTIGVLVANVILLFTGIFLISSNTFAEVTVAGSNTENTNSNNANSSTTTKSKAVKKSKAVENTNYHMQDNPSVNMEDFGAFTPVESVGEFMTKIITFLMKILGGVGVLAIVAGGIMIMYGGFSEDVLENGKTLLLYSVIGVGIALLAMVIVTLAQSFLYSFGT